MDQSNQGFMKKSKDLEYEVKFRQTLKRNPHKGLYVAFEGIDGAGKSVQMDRLEAYLLEKGKNPMIAYQPRREGPVGSLINQILQGNVKVPFSSLQYLFTADRIIDHMDRIEPALKSGKIVISHRCMWSNLPYGMIDFGIDDFDSDEGRVIDVAHGLMSLYHQFVIPDLTFYLKVSAETAVKRLQEKSQHLELYEKKNKLEKVAKGYEWQIKKFPGEFVVIDGERTPEEVHQEVIKYVEEALK